MRHFTLAFLCVIGLTAGVAGQSHGGSSDMRATVKGNNQFATDLFGRLGQDEGNLFLSPYSISAALAMTYLGARGTTADQMRAVLQFELDDTEMHAAFRALIGETRGGDGIQLNVANMLWGQDGYPYTQRFLDDTRTYYGAGLREVDFKKDLAAARAAINDWVAQETQGKIENLIEDGDLTPMTRLVLTNAVYFFGDWRHPFDVSATQDGDFMLAGGGTVEVPLMRQVSRFGYLEHDAFQALDLPYENDALRLLVFLPTPGTTIGEMAKTLTPNELEQWRHDLGSSRSEVDVTLPRFNMAAAFSLADVLSTMGMPDAFDPQRADFSGIAGIKNLFIGAVVHKAFIEVNERGTEAAAATGVVVEKLMAPAQPARPVVFRADHPFIFVIEDTRTDSILFLGRMMNPLG